MIQHNVRRSSEPTEIDNAEVAQGHESSLDDLVIPEGSNARFSGLKYFFGSMRNPDKLYAEFEELRDISIEHTKRGQFDEAYEIANRIPRDHGGSPYRYSAIASMATEHANRGEISRARDVLKYLHRDSMRMHSGSGGAEGGNQILNVDPLIAIANRHAINGDYDQADAVFQEAIDLASNQMTLASGRVKEEALLRIDKAQKQVQENREANQEIVLTLPKANQLEE